MKTYRRYTSEAQILAAIEKCYQEARRHLERAEAFEVKIRSMQKQGAAFNMQASVIDDLKAEIETLRGKADRLIEVRAKKLGNKLSEFRTALLPISGIEGEPGVPMRLTNKRDAANIRANE